MHHKRNPRVMIDDPQTDFYSSEDNSSNSEDDTGPFKLEKPSLSNAPHEHGGTSSEETITVACIMELPHHQGTCWKTLQGIN